MTDYCGNLAFKIIDVFNSFMVGPVVISMKMKRLVDFWFKTLHMWRLSITSIVGIQLQLHGFKVQRNYCIQNSSGGPSGHINVNHRISNHLFQNSTTAEIIRHKLFFWKGCKKIVVYFTHSSSLLFIYAIIT